MSEFLSSKAQKIQANLVICWSFFTKRPLTKNLGFLVLLFLCVSLITISLGNSVQALSSKPGSYEKPHNSPTIVAQISSLRGCWTLSYHNAAGIIHKSILVMEGYSGIMRTIYWSLSTRQTETIEQTMKLKDSASGILIVGYNPVLIKNNRRFLTTDYNPDNFLFSTAPDGTFTAFNCDDKLDCSPVEVQACPT